MKALSNALYVLARAMHHVAGVLLIGMVLVILANVVTRAIFGATGGAIDITFTGAVELVSYGLLFMVLFTLPFAVRRGQVIVDLFTGGMGERAKAVLAGAYTVGFGLLGVGMTLRLVEAAERVALSGETTQDLLLPLSYIYGISAFGAAMLALRGMAVALQQIVEGFKAS